MNKINDLNGFMKRIQLLYPASFKEPGSYDAWSETCVEELYNPKTDYNKLFKYVVLNNPNENFAPSVTWLIEKSKLCYKEDVKKEQKQAWRSIKFRPPYCPKGHYIRDCFPATATNEQIQAVYKKKFPNLDNLDIIYE